MKQFKVETYLPKEALEDIKNGLIIFDDESLYENLMVLLTTRISIFCIISPPFYLYSII